MTSVIIVAKDQDKQIWDRLPAAISDNVPSVLVRKRNLESFCKETQYMICDLDSFKTVQTEFALVIFKDIRQVASEVTATGPMVAIVDASNPKLLPYVSDTKLPAVTCGLSARDTITLSSINEDSAVINLQRSIQCFDGSVAEPQEIPLKLTRDYDSFTLMAAAAVFIVSGNIDQLSNAHF